MSGSETPARVRIPAPAKINLFLRILAREESGYHQLETLFQWVGLYDDVRMETAVDFEGARLTVETEDPEWELGPENENLAHRAGLLLLARVREMDRPTLPGLRIHLRKGIPPLSGLGGGSSDAAAVLRGGNRLLGDPLDRVELLTLAARLGADVPAFLSTSPTTLAWGRGERLLPLRALPSIGVLIALPPIPIATPEAYARVVLEQAEGGSRGTAPALFDSAALAGWGGVAREARNDFEATTFDAIPVLGRMKEAMEGAGAAFALLSGSGSALFSVHPTREGLEGAAAELSREFPEVRFVATRTLDALPVIEEG